MSTAQVHATVLLCRLLELTKPQVNGAALLSGEFGEGGAELIHERLLTLGAPLNYVTCSDCGIEMARVVRPVSVDQILLYCDECGEVQTGRELQQTYTVSLPRLIQRLAGSFEFPSASSKVIDNEFSWRLGVQEHKRGKAQTWYFARHLDDQAVAKRLLYQIRIDQALRSSKIITSTALPLPYGSPLADFTLMNLASIARLSQSRFAFFSDRIGDPAQTIHDDQAPKTSLIHVREHAVVYVDGVRHPLEPMQARIFLALMGDFDHRMEANQIRDKCGSRAVRFVPIKYFGRNPLVYHRFINYVEGDDEYELLLPEEDRHWLS